MVISVYNEEGYFQQNESDKHVINSCKAKVVEDGAVTIHFGGDKSQSNFLPIMKNWNYMLRIYLPESSYLEGIWGRYSYKMSACLHIIVLTVM
ncbi:DUF1214 domain-containing protein [Colwellia psychrerythraea]|uniref:DUF1214 domain-containing protein n=1 Tax=Colwellia psychrerythraea (strain 34H / ATCC BAA-681) TaxID=167879 RepID=Q483K4_COLP3|nr:hypothetical protein CPS_2034 [Colwellia psychrerythraea 34H]